METDVTCSKDNAHQSNGNNEGHLDSLSSMALTYIPGVPSTFGETDYYSTSDSSKSDSRDEIDDNSEPTAQTQYNHRSRPNIDYSCTTRIDETEPPRLNAALSCADRLHWTHAIKEEFKMILENRTWILFKNIGNQNRTLSSGIVLRVKRDSMGNVVRRKARLVVLGTLRPGAINNAELYAPVACIELVRLMLSVSVSKGCHIHQLDIKSAFLHASLPDKGKLLIKLPKLREVPSLNG